MIKDDTRPNFVLFLTDGLPTVGETNEAKIAANAKQNNKLHAGCSISASATTSTAGCSIGLSRENYGQSEYVRPDENIEAHVSSVYNKLGCAGDDRRDGEGRYRRRVARAGGVSRVYPKEVYDLFAGEQLVIVGRYKKAGRREGHDHGQGRRQGAEVRFSGQLRREIERPIARRSSKSCGRCGASARSSTRST